MQKRKNRRHSETHFWCKFCGSPELVVHYSYTGWGTASVMTVGRDGKVKDWQDDEDWDRSNWKVEYVTCGECDKSGDVLTLDVNVVKDLKNFRYET